MASIIKNETSEWAELPHGRKAIDGKWVFTIKVNSDGTISRFKERYVVKGFSQQPGVDYMETFAPVASYPTIRIFLTIVAARDWECKQCDVCTAFLNASSKRSSM